jgi:hypothetical protein
MRKAIPIWTDARGSHYFHFSEIGDEHMLNIVLRLEDAGIPVPKRFYQELNKRGIDWDGDTCPEEVEPDTGFLAMDLTTAPSGGII